MPGTLRSHSIEVQTLYAHFFFSKSQKRPTLHQAGISYKKEYITDNKHVIWKDASKRSEGIRD